MKLNTLYKRNTDGSIQESTAEIEDDKWRVISGKLDGKKVMDILKKFVKKPY